LSIIQNKNDAEKIDILLVDDDPDFSTQISEVLSQYGYRVHQQKDIYQLDAAIIKHEPLALLVDMEADADSECNTLIGWLMGLHGTWPS
ncbi:hypothetical protein SB912_29290, partial [Pantoea sp. SIMBA_072]